MKPAATMVNVKHVMRASPGLKRGNVPGPVMSRTAMTATTRATASSVRTTSSAKEESAKVGSLTEHVLSLYFVK